MPRLARGIPPCLTRNVRCMRMVCRPCLARLTVAAESKRKQDTQSISPNGETSLNPLAHQYVDSRISTTMSLERPPILQKPESELRIKTVKVEARDRILQVLSPEEEATFKSRLSKIWDGMMPPEIHPDWKEITSRFSKDKWLSWITRCTPDNVKSILVSPYPPTPDDLQALPWSNAINSGVLAWCTDANGGQDSTKRMPYVYVSSASGRNGGLSRRKSNMLSESFWPHDRLLKFKIKKLGSNPKGEFKELFMVPLEKEFAGGIMNARALVILARLVLMIWLGAVDKKMKPKIKDLVPWGLENIKYGGLAEGNPLMLPINGSSRQRRRRLRAKNRPGMDISNRKLSHVSDL